MQAPAVPSRTPSVAPAAPCLALQVKRGQDAIGKDKAVPIVIGARAAAGPPAPCLARAATHGRPGRGLPFQYGTVSSKAERSASQTGCRCKSGTSLLTTKGSLRPGRPAPSHLAHPVHASLRPLPSHAAARTPAQRRDAWHAAAPSALPALSVCTRPLHAGRPGQGRQQGELRPRQPGAEAGALLCAAAGAAQAPGRPRGVRPPPAWLAVACSWAAPVCQNAGDLVQTAA